VTGSSFYVESNLLFQEAFVVKFAPNGDPLYYTRRLHGFSGQEGGAIAVDSVGNAYVTGYTQSSDFPVIDADDDSLGGSQDAFLAKLDPSGAIVYSTYLGGSGSEAGRALALRPDGSIYVAGATRSTDFPTRGAVQTALRGPQDLFLTLFSPEGRIVSSTYLGGSGSERLQGLGLDDAGFLYLASITDSVDFPLRDPSQSGCLDRFISKLSPDFQPLASTCVPGADVQGLAVEPGGTVSLTGLTSGGLPVINAFQPQPAGETDAFAIRFQINSAPDCVAAFASPATIWPPDGRLAPVAIRNVIDPDGDPVAITVTGVRQDEPLQGTANATGIGTPSVQLRADRDGKGDGRVYRLSFTARDPQGASCTGTVAVCVPHDQGRGTTCGDGGGLFDSGG
jgi:hypothetical protein